MSALVSQVVGYLQLLQRKLKQREGPGLSERYIARAAAGSLALRVTSLSLVFIYEFSKGVPREAIKACMSALTIGSMLEVDLIDAEVVRESIE